MKVYRLERDGIGPIAKQPQSFIDQLDDIYSSAGDTKGTFVDQRLSELHRLNGKFWHEVSNGEMSCCLTMHELYNVLGPTTTKIIIETLGFEIYEYEATVIEGKYSPWIDITKPFTKTKIAEK